MQNIKKREPSHWPMKDPPDERDATLEEEFDAMFYPPDVPDELKEAV